MNLRHCPTTLSRNYFNILSCLCSK